MSADLVKGSTLGGKYRIERLIGRGGMGEVYAASHAALGQRVAIKVLALRFMDDDLAAMRFLREARAAAQIGGPHVVRVIDVGTLQAGRPYLVMELLEGRDLAQAIREDGPMAVPAAVDLTLELLEGVAEAHAKGIVHRDLKPSNVFLAERGGARPEVKILDFGIAKVASRSGDVALTTTGRVLGSAAFASPEQLRGTRAIELRSDIWSIGAMLYQLVSGELPFQGESAIDVAAAVLEREPRPLSEIVPELPEELERVIRTCLERDVERRFGDVAELADALSPLGSNDAPAVAERIRERLSSAHESSGTEEQELPLEAENWRTETVDARLEAQPGTRTSATWAGARDTGSPTNRRRSIVLASLGLISIVGLLIAIGTSRRPAQRTVGPASSEIFGNSGRSMPSNSAAIGEPPLPASAPPARPATSTPEPRPIRKNDARARTAPSPKPSASNAIPSILRDRL